MKSHKRRRKILPLMFLSLVGGLTLFIFTTVNRPTPPLPIPVAANMGYGESLADACEPLREKHISCSSQFIIDAAAPGTLLKQQSHGSMSHLIYSRGPAQVTVPIVTGLSLTHAKELLWRAGLALGKIEKLNNAAPRGVVIDAGLSPAIAVANGSTVDLTYSTGKILLPNWVGQTQELAQAEAKQLGAKLNIKFSPGAPGLVQAQSAKPGAVDANATVTLTVGKAMAQTPVLIPNVVGMTQEQAVALLASSGFTNIETMVTQDGAVVTSIEPKVNTPWDPTQTVKLTVGNA